MRFAVSHETLYRYARPVRLTPQKLRLTPRAEGVTMISCELLVTPTPAVRRESRDAFGHVVTEVEFDGLAIVHRRYRRSRFKKASYRQPYGQGIESAHNGAVEPGRSEPVGR